MDLHGNKFTDFIQDNEKAKWRTVNNHNISNFTEDDIKRITKNYSTPIGKGGFGQVYHGALDDGTPVAVKKYICQNLKEGFAKEITVHCQINHRNVVRLLGYCTEENALMIVTEYVPRGNLGDLLHGSRDPISLDTRLGIAIECAEALRYMHSSMYQTIIHGDIKPDNILLDGRLGAKLSDFGLSRLLLCMDEAQYTMNVVGSIGYMDPEQVETGLLDPANDVYSFGVVLLELITRAKASKSGFNSGLKRNFIDALRKGKQEARAMFDTEIANERNIHILDEIGNLAAECFTKGFNERPEMKDVQERLQILRKALHCEKASEKKGQGSSWGAEDTTQKINQHVTSVSSSSTSYTAPYKLNILGILNRKARRNFNRNAGPILATCNLNIFTKRSLEKITRNYSIILDRGDFGPFYMGYIDDNKVAVKDCPMIDEAGKFDFVNMVVSASQHSHKNIMRLVGCCLETAAPVLVYEFTDGGSLHNILHGGHCPPLELRLDIAIGSAEALAYLHSFPTKIIHGNIRCTNILLDGNFVPKVSGHSIRQLRNILNMDRDYVRTGLCTEKSDVYSFGNVLLELITRKQASLLELITRNQVSLQNIFILEEMGKLAVEWTADNILILEEMGKLAVECHNWTADKRPEMAEVVVRLQKLRRDWKAGGSTAEGAALMSCHADN